MIEVTDSAVILTIRVIPRAGKPGPAGTRNGALLIRLSAPPVDGAANAELIALLADLLDVPKRAIAIVSGERSRLKRVRIAGIEPSRVRDRLSV